jgi:cobalt/nickel transport system permease protein
MAGHNSFIERSLTGALSFLKESVFAEEFAAKPGFLQSLDPRIKVITIFLMIIATVLTRSIAVSCALYALCLILAYFSAVKISFFLKRTWVFIPLFSLFIAIPALFSFFSPGESLYSVSLIGHKLSITRQGIMGAALFVIRVTASVSFAVLLSLTTRHFDLLKVLRIFGIPQVFVMTIGMCYRYIYLFLEVAENTYLAIKSRVGTRVHYKKGQHMVAWNMASLWLRSYHLNDQVYQAMLSRGYTGEPAVLENFKTRWVDWVWLFATGLLFVALIRLNGVIR